MRAVLGVIARYAAKHGYPPSMQQIMDETGFGSKSVVGYSLDACEEEGLIVRARGLARAVTLTEAGRAFAEAPSETGSLPARREEPAPDGTGSTETADAATDTEPQPSASDRKTPGPRRRRRLRPAGTDAAHGVGARIREARRSAGLTQRELAALVGVYPQTAWYWEAGRVAPTYEHRVAVASHCRDACERTGGTDGTRSRSGGGGGGRLPGRRRLPARAGHRVDLVVHRLRALAAQGQAGGVAKRSLLPAHTLPILTGREP